VLPIDHRDRQRRWRDRYCLTKSGASPGLRPGWQECLSDQASLARTRCLNETSLCFSTPPVCDLCAKPSWAVEKLQSNLLIEATFVNRGSDCDDQRNWWAFSGSPPDVALRRNPLCDRCSAGSADVRSQQRFLPAGEELNSTRKTSCAEHL
jgi:hypothetical protein